MKAEKTNFGQCSIHKIPFGDGDGSGTPPPTAAAGEGADGGVGAGELRF